MNSFVCVTCGTGFAPAAEAPAACPICEDERQYIGPGGQRFTTLPALRRTHSNAWRVQEPDLFGMFTVPSFAIGQRALLVRTQAGNVLWDCITLLDDATVALINALGGLAAIAISHPHYYTTMVDWAEAFDAPVWLHEADRAHVMRPDPRLRFWSGATQALLPGLTLIHAPGHFDGAAMLHWASGADGRGALFSGDILQVVPDRRYVSFMRSYPNLVPLPASTVRRIAASTMPFAFERIYGAFWDRVVTSDAKAAVSRSAERYVRWVSEDDSESPNHRGLA